MVQLERKTLVTMPSFKGIISRTWRTNFPLSNMNRDSLRQKRRSEKNGENFM